MLTKVKPNPVLTKPKPKAHANKSDTQSASEIQKILIVALTRTTIWDIQWLFQDYRHLCNIDLSSKV